MAIWTANRSVEGFGQFAVFAEHPGRARANVTFFRGAPITITSYSYGDPFSDATAELLFPQITPFDDPDAPNMWFLQEWTNYDIYWVPVTAYKGSPQDINVINPIHGTKNLWMNMADKEIIWEGFSVSYEPTEQGMKLQLQGALYQLDRYLATPSYPPRPFVMEKLIKKYFNPQKRALRTQRLRYNFPDGWTKVFEPDERDRIYRPKGVSIGDKWTGMSTRNTGTFSERLLTGYIQDLLSQMYTGDDCGVASGDQWTIRKYPGRRPYLEVRERARPPDFNIWYGTPGVEVSLTRDAMSITNIIYGQGTGLDQVKWSRMVIGNDGKYTGYDPIAYDPNVYPYDDGSIRDPTQMPAETLTVFAPGVSEADGMVASKKMLARDSDPGWVGNITIKSDTASDIIRWKITAGMTVNLKGFAGNREGIPLHIAEAIHNPEQGTVSMRVDTRYRDLLTLEEVQARVRDPLTPVKMLQVNKRSLLIEDQLAPWDYSRSGIIPTPAKEFFHSMPRDTSYPWENWTKEYPPRTHEEFYIRCNANSGNPDKRWGHGIVLMSQAGSAKTFQIAAFDRDGTICKVPFHVSIYYHEDVSYPQTDGNTSPFLPNHFQNMAPDGSQWGDNDHFIPDSNAFIVGWGNYEERAGYTPNRYSDSGSSPTGLMIDESVWSWNMVENEKFDPFWDESPEQRKKDHKENMKRDTRSLWVHVYCENDSDVFFMGRIYRLEPGV